MVNSFSRLLTSKRLRYGECQYNKRDYPLDDVPGGYSRDYYNSCDNPLYPPDLFESGLPDACTCGDWEYCPLNPEGKVNNNAL